jgi:ketosteroid isomerase-like protein
MEADVAAELPDNLVRYFAAQNDRDADGMTACFAPDAQVRDEGRTYVGRKAIREWKLETIAKYNVTVRPLSSTIHDGVRAVIANVSGSFPGSPVDLTFDFKLDQAGLIHSLEIH